MLMSIFSNAVGYYRYRYSNLTVIPEWVMIQASRPFLVAMIASAIATLAAWTCVYFAKYKIAIVVGLLNFVFDYINFNIIGESWNF